MPGIISFGAYVPRLRLARSAIAVANAWFNPNLAGMARGSRSLANWDEDAITMAVEAARQCLPPAVRNNCAKIYLASTTLPFADRQNAGIVAGALQLPSAVETMDVTGSQRAGTTALMTALGSVLPAQKTILVAASDRRRTLAASSQEMQYGDGGAAIAVGDEHVIARLLTSEAATVEFVDHFRATDAAYDYAWEERWVRDEGYLQIAVPTAQRCLDKAGIDAARIDHFILASTSAAVPKAVAKALRISEGAIAGNLAAECGDTGAAHPLLMLVAVLEKAQPGEHILLLGFGEGCDALVFEVTDAIVKSRPPASLSNALRAGREETNYTKLLAFNDQLPLDKGMRAEINEKTPLTVLYRNRKMMFGLVGGKCGTCGAAQFPKAALCVNPECRAADTQDDYSFADLQPQVLSWSADALTFTLDPPAYYGMLTFADGGRFMADFADCAPGDVDVGTRMRMVFRIKAIDPARRFKHYFWKAAPVAADRDATEQR